jgi:hypothetical protein
MPQALFAMAVVFMDARTWETVIRDCPGQLPWLATRRNAILTSVVSSAGHVTGHEVVDETLGVAHLGGFDAPSKHVGSFGAHHLFLVRRDPGPDNERPPA